MATLEELEPYFATSPTLNRLHKEGLPLTRRAFIAVATMGLEDYDWNEEDEAGLPEPLQDYDALAAERADREDED